MKIMSKDAVVKCDHDGTVRLTAQQGMVRVDGVPLLVDDDPEGRTIVRCPNYGPNIKPCTKTNRVQEGYSTFVRIDGRAVCLDTVTGFTNGTPPGVVTYTVRDPGQAWLDAGS